MFEAVKVRYLAPTANRGARIKIIWGDYKKVFPRRYEFGVIEDVMRRIEEVLPLRTLFDASAGADEDIIFCEIDEEKFEQFRKEALNG